MPSTRNQSSRRPSGTPYRPRATSSSVNSAPALPPDDSVTTISTMAPAISAAVSAALKPLADRLDRLEAGLPSGTSVTSSHVNPPSVSNSVPLGRENTSHALKIWASVPQATIDEIVTGQFVDFQQLIPPSPLEEQSPSYVLALNDHQSGSLTFTTQSRAGRKIVNLDLWLEAWTVFAAVYVNAHPSRAAELLAYQHQVLKAHKKFTFAAVAEYDRAFRHSLANDATLRWNVTPHTLYTTVFDARAVRPFRSGAAVASGTAPLPTGTTPVSTDFCRLFNRGICRRVSCSYTHRCSTCNSDSHGARTCRSGQASNRTSKPTVSVDAN